jgi:phosphatidylglycerophosphate synthase
MSSFEAASLPPGREPLWRIASVGLRVAAVMALALGIAPALALPPWPAGLTVALVTAGVLWRFHHQDGEGRFGLANWVTLFRLNLVSLVLLVSLSGGAGTVSSWALFTVAFVALLLDGVDGWLARRRHEASDFGERFDMAADTAFTLILTFCLLALGLVGPWVLVIGMLRPAFVLAGRLRPALAAPLPPSRGRKVVCAAALCCLVTGLAPPLAPAAPLLAGSALALLVGSFGRDLGYLRQRAAVARP